MKKKLLLLFWMGSLYSFIAVLIQCILLNAVFATNTVAQQIKSVKDVLIEVEFNNAKLNNVFQELEFKTSYKFVYDKKDKFLGNNFSLKKQNITVEQLLLKISRESNLTFKQVNNNISVFQNEKTKYEKEIEIIIQTTRVTGKVTDLDSEALPGVNIIEKGTSNGTITDLNGTFSIDVAEEATLLFSYVGFVSEEVAVNGRQVVDVVLTPDIKALSEIVVVGYGTQKKKDLTGSISTVKSEEIKSLPVPSVSDALQGRASGVQVISSGRPGDDAQFRIRGTGTINNSNPLIVIDGTPVSGGLNQLNPNDIESIQVLKDASAAAIYGSRGANGVIIVTTKRGTGESGRLDFDVYTGVQQATNMVNMLDASEFAALHNEMMANNGLAKNPAFNTPESLGVGTDWLGELFQTAPIQSYSMSYASSNDKTNFYVSGNMFNQDGIILETSFKRYTAQFNSDTRIFEWLKFGNNLTLNHDVKNSVDYNIRNTMAALPTQPVLNADGTYSGPEGHAIWSGDITNPIGRAKLIENTTKGYNLMGSVYAEVNILENLIFKTNAGLKANLWDGRNWAPKYDWKPSPEAQSFLGRNFNKSFSWLWDNTLTYSKIINDIHNLNVMIGTSAQANRYDGMGGSVKGFASDLTQQLDNGTETPTLGGNANEWSLLSYFGRVNYVYDDKYLFTGTVRRDGSSRFGEGNKWGVFPMGSVAWRISNEDFFNVPAVDDLKIRAGYGLTGNQEIGLYSFASVLQTVMYNFNNTTVPAVVPDKMPNPFLKWEAVEQSNIGIDLSMFNDRITLSIDGYIKNTKDMLVQMNVPVSTGYSYWNKPEINAGKMQNKGVELTLSTNNLTGELQWNTDFNVSYNKNKVVSLNDSVPLSRGGVSFNYNVARIQEGYPINLFYGFQTNGIFQTEEEVENYAVQVPGADPYNRTSPGDIKFMDLNHNGVIEDNDRTFIGNPNPKFIFAMNNSFAYKGLDLTVFLQGIYGNDIFNANKIWNEGMAVTYNQTKETLNRWNGEGTSNTMPRAVFNDPNKNTRASDRYIEDGSYLRIKNVTLGYTLPNAVLEKLHMRSVRLYLSGQNLLTFTKYSGIDPEVSFDGIDNNVYPVTRTMSVGLNVGF